MDERQPKGASEVRVDVLTEFLARVESRPRGLGAQLDTAAAEVLDAFDGAGIDALLLKGPGLATLLYGRADARVYSDIDLLVAPDEFAAAGEALRAHGYVYAGEDDGIDDVGGVVHAQKWVRIEAPDHPTIDLHRWLPGARVSPAVAWNALAGRRAWVKVGGRHTPVPNHAVQAMHLATHAAQHGPRSKKNLDELELALAAWPPEVWDSAALVAKEIGATDAFAAGLRLTCRGAAEATRLGLDRTDELDWRIRHQHERPRGTYHLQALADAGRWSERLKILRRSLLPGRTWIANQHPWASAHLGVTAAYGLHLARAPLWATRAWVFRQRAQRAGRAR
jgi:Uncharacterised nucleotidyltransferase